MAGLLSTYIRPTQTAPVWEPSTSNPAVAATPVIPTLSGYDATKGTASTASQTNWDVGDNQLVEKRMAGLLSSGSDYMALNETAAQQQAAQRGLANSSMAVQAGRAAAIQSALPIAQQDAQTFARSGEFNANSANANSQFNAGQDQRISLANMDAENAAGQFGAQQRNAGALEGARMGSETNKFNVQQQNTMLSERDRLGQDYSKFATQQENAIAEADAGRAAEAGIAQLRADTEIAKSVMDTETRIAVTDLEAKYNTQMQGSKSAGDLYAQMLKNVTDISANKDMEAGAKQTAINNQITMLNSGMKVLSTISGLDLPKLLDFGTLATVAPSYPYFGGYVQPDPGYESGSGAG